MKTVEVKSKTRGGGRCCLCFDPCYVQNLSVVVFFCCHAYHISCLIGATDSINEASNASDSGDDSESEGAHSMRRVLCTTAGRWMFLPKEWFCVWLAYAFSSEHVEFLYCLANVFLSLFSMHWCLLTWGVELVLFSNLFCPNLKLDW